MMHIDNGFDDLPSEDRLKQRQLVLKDKVDAYFAWAKEKYAQVAHQGATGKALAYSLNQEAYLRQSLHRHAVIAENNRPIVVCVI